MIFRGLLRNLWYPLKLDSEEIKELNRSVVIKNHLIKRPKPIKFAQDYSKIFDNEKDKDNNKNNKENKDNKIDKENKNYIIKKERSKPVVKDYLREIA